jgi:hypothetical protein
MMVIVLLPDIVLGWRQVKGDEESRLILPASVIPERHS